MTGPNEFHMKHRSMMSEPRWKFEIADWVISASWGGLIDHHMRVTNRCTDVNGHRWYQIFDTTLTRGVADYNWIMAEIVEGNSQLVQRPDAIFVPAILQRASFCTGLKYSILERSDCESLQRWIQTGQEQYRWSPQVLKAVGEVIKTLVQVSIESQKQQSRQKNINKARPRKSVR